MRHRNKKAILNRPADQRKAMVRNLVTSLFLYGKVKTTGARAKVLSSEAEKLITKTKKRIAAKDEMNAIRFINQTIFTEDSAKNLMAYAGKTKKTSGFTRATKIGFRAGDNALLVQVELIEE
jgi:large subunit ribosomal protein L17